MHYYQFHIGDYRAATAHLSNDEDLAYRRLLDMYYDLEQSIPADMNWVSRRIRIEPKVIEAVLRDMFVSNQDGTWSNPRADIEIAEYHQRHERASRAGRASVERRLQNGLADFQHDLSDVEPTNNHKPITINQEPKKTKAAITASPFGVSDSVWADFLALRKSKKAPVTQTALSGIQREATRAGLTLEQALQTACERGWTGFKAEWVSKTQPARQIGSDRNLAAARTIFGDERKIYDDRIIESDIPTLTR